MYGATEATARMAYLPPELAHDDPTAIGRADPRWRVHIDALERRVRRPTSASWSTAART